MHQPRPLTRADLPGIWRVRYAVRENTLVPGRISDEEVIERMETTGRGWGFDAPDGSLAGFAIACGDTGGDNAGRIWALFVHPEHQGRGYGGPLHDTMVDWLFALGLPRLWLDTGAETRAVDFYLHRGWSIVGRTHADSLLLELFPHTYKPHRP
ncbi:GNAT family N-acetyltransferase [Pelomonas sp. KK5]|uniref:GNAT family N-acetyltransferase n=1 Tax=Pelomonas sp. KK5 TaxID=1855730 RepID=UPI001301FE84|nr:GNAT family N-acetyltransferase [Pelomonas sp. KK5]